MWAKISDDFFRNPKVVKAGRDARDLYLVGLCHCNEHLTDGFIDGAYLRRLGADAEIDNAKEAASKLVEAGLWHETDGGYLVNDFKQHQIPTKVRDESYLRFQKEVFERDGYACVYCDSPLNLTLDHIIPQSRGGSHTPDNLCTACRSCNSSKGARTPEEWMVAR